MEFSIKDAVKTIAKSSQRNFLFITFIFILPLSLFQMLFLRNLFELVFFVSNLTDDKSMISYFIYNFVYLVFFLTFYLLSTSAMTFTIASRFVSKRISCVSTLLAIPRLSKRILITFVYPLPLMICAYLANFTFIYLLINVLAEMNNAIAVIFAFIYSIFVTVADAYMIAFWNLANVISVLEPNAHGLSAMKRSKQLLSGETAAASALFVSLYLVAVWVSLLIENLAMDMDYDIHIIARILLFVFCVIIMTGVNFVGLIGQSVMYYACKSYNNQVIHHDVLYAYLDGKEYGNSNYNSAQGDNMEVNEWV